MTITGQFLVLRRVALSAALLGAAGAIGLMLYVGRRNRSIVLLFMFAAWVLCPFVLMVVADRASSRWTPLTRATLYWLMLIIAAGTLAIYGNVVWRPRAQPAAPFLLVPPASCFVAAVCLLIAAVVSRRDRGSAPGAS